jgi:hypothetical protein
MKEDGANYNGSRKNMVFFTVFVPCPLLPPHLYIIIYAWKGSVDLSQLI